MTPFQLNIAGGFLIGGGIAELIGGSVAPALIIAGLWMSGSTFFNRITSR